MDTITFLMCCGHVMPVLLQMIAWVPKVDQSLIRYFTIKVLQAIEPPYSRDFLSCFIDIVADTFRRDTLNNEDTRQVLTEFVGYCAHNEPELSGNRLAKLKRDLEN
jgi:hypothetical protein